MQKWYILSDSVWFDVGISVNVDNLKVLHSLVQSVASKWEEIGKQLPPYKHQVAKDKDTLHETLNSWLKHTKPCSLQQLCAALRHETVNETELSGRLKREFLATKSKFVISLAFIVAPCKICFCFHSKSSTQLH